MAAPARPVHARASREDKPVQTARQVTEPDPVEVLDAAVRILARLVVHVSGINSRTGASFRQIITSELRLGTAADVDLIEAWLTHHSGS